MGDITLTFTPMEHATLMSLTGLGFAVMLDDKERGQEYITILSSPGVEAAAQALLAKMVAPLKGPSTPSPLVLE
jgi:hypothetical protein